MKLSLLGSTPAASTIFPCKHKGFTMSRAPSPAGNEQVDVASQLGKLADLRDKGVLTEEEFQGQKKKLLGL